MSERSIVITEQDGDYQIHNSVFSQFELIGILEQIVFDLKNSKISTANEPKSTEEKSTPLPAPEKTVSAGPSAADTAPENPAEDVSSKAAKNSASPELKTRIGNAVKAIKDLGGKVETVDLNKMSAEELQTELEELTAQYKRLKSAKG